MPKPKIQARVSDALRDRLRAEAERSGGSVSAVIRDALRAHLTDPSDSNDDTVDDPRGASDRGTVSDRDRDVSDPSDGDGFSSDRTPLSEDPVPRRVGAPNVGERAPTGGEPTDSQGDESTDNGGGIFASVFG